MMMQDNDSSSSAGAIQTAQHITLGFFNGLTYPFRGFNFVFIKHPSLFRIWIWPILILLFLCCITIVKIPQTAAGMLHNLVLHHEPGFIGDKLYTFSIEHPRLYQVLVPMISIMVVIITLWVLLIVAPIFSAPFNDILSEKVEILITGQDGAPFSWSQFLKDAVRSIRVESIKLVIYILIIGPLFIGSFICAPVGPILYSVVGFLMTTTYLAVDYIDWPASRRGLGIRARVALLRKHFSLLLGFGTGVWLLLLIPIINLFFMPAAVAGGTMLYLKLEELKSKDHVN